MTDQQARAHLAELAAAVHDVDLGAKGFAAFVSPACKAYRALAGDVAALARIEPDLARLAQDGSPAAIVYALLLLRALGRDVGAVIARHGDDPRPCTVWPGGCSPATASLGEATRWVLAR